MTSGWRRLWGYQFSWSLTRLELVLNMMKKTLTFSYLFSAMILFNQSLICQMATEVLDNTRSFERTQLDLTFEWSHYGKTCEEDQTKHRD